MVVRGFAATTTTTRSASLPSLRGNECVSNIRRIYLIVKETGHLSRRPTSPFPPHPSPFHFVPDLLDEFHRTNFAMCLYARFIYKLAKASENSANAAALRIANQRPDLNSF